MNEPWQLFTGEGEPKPNPQIPEPPPWRRFERPGQPAGSPDISEPTRYWARARSYRSPPAVIDAVNAALRLRRPLLVTGTPGTGKTTLIYRVAYELSLGPVFEWPVTSRSRVQDGLYAYDALARLQDHQMGAERAASAAAYITLRSLGSALVPAARPRVLLIDELDKADPDLPNDLLNLLEEGRFEIPELIRESAGVARVRGMSPSGTRGGWDVEVLDGVVACTEFPFIVMTSNGEREFAPAFLRRCIQVRLPKPDAAMLESVVQAHLGPERTTEYRQKIEEFAAQPEGSLATDQLLNAVFLLHGATALPPEKKAELEALVLTAISRG